MKLGCALTAAMAVCGGALHAQGRKLEVTPAQVMNDQTAAIRVTGLRPSQQVTLRADLVDGENQPWAAEAEFVADAAGAGEGIVQDGFGDGAGVVNDAGCEKRAHLPAAARPWSAADPVSPCD